VKITEKLISKNQQSQANLKLNKNFAGSSTVKGKNYKLTQFHNWETSLADLGRVNVLP
ncbi:MAG: hypothetical protein RLZZ532_1192, partial [Cyanobacteriota bacterium]